ncbi:unnamed protein product [Prorocentrum cordatum]|uniref:Beta-lactamase-related domain-containing protein n=1 Tax=Prorocentrum cordatum TaxID=2364126 RepID=A0ABN9T5N0_9DINO|nr:unnamed protein product [Polarella glacialis]
MAALPLRHRPGLGRGLVWSGRHQPRDRGSLGPGAGAVHGGVVVRAAGHAGPDTGFYVPAEKGLGGPRLAALYGSHDTATWLGEASSTRPAPKIPSELVRLDGQTPSESRWAKPNVGPVIAGGGMMGHNGGGLVSTLNDQARFFLMVARGGQLSPEGPRILRPETARQMVEHDWLAEPSVLGSAQD